MCGAAYIFRTSSSAQQQHQHQQHVRSACVFFLRAYAFYHSFSGLLCHTHECRVIFSACYMALGDFRLWCRVVIVCVYFQSVSPRFPYTHAGLHRVLRAHTKAHMQRTPERYTIILRAMQRHWSERNETEALKASAIHTAHWLTVNDKWMCSIKMRSDSRPVQKLLIENLFNSWLFIHLNCFCFRTHSVVLTSAVAANCQKVFFFVVSIFILNSKAVKYNAWLLIDLC